MVGLIGGLGGALTDAASEYNRAKEHAEDRSRAHAAEDRATEDANVLRAKGEAHDVAETNPMEQSAPHIDTLVQFTGGLLQKAGGPPPAPMPEAPAGGAPQSDQGPLMLPQDETGNLQDVPPNSQMVYGLGPQGTGRVSAPAPTIGKSSLPRIPRTDPVPRAVGLGSVRGSGQVPQAAPTQFPAPVRPQPQPSPGVNTDPKPSPGLSESAQIPSAPSFQDDMASLHAQAVGVQGKWQALKSEMEQKLATIPAEFSKDERTKRAYTAQIYREYNEKLKPLEQEGDQVFKAAAAAQVKQFSRELIPALMVNQDINEVRTVLQKWGVPPEATAGMHIGKDDAGNVALIPDEAKSGKASLPASLFMEMHDPNATFESVRKAAAKVEEINNKNMEAQKKLDERDHEFHLRIEGTGRGKDTRTTDEKNAEYISDLEDKRDAAKKNGDDEGVARYQRLIDHMGKTAGEHRQDTGDSSEDRGYRAEINSEINSLVDKSGNPKVTSGTALNDSKNAFDKRNGDGAWIRDVQPKLQDAQRAALAKFWAQSNPKGLAAPKASAQTMVGSDGKPAAVPPGAFVDGAGVVVVPKPGAPGKFMKVGTIQK